MPRMLFFTILVSKLQEKYHLILTLQSISKKFQSREKNITQTEKQSELLLFLQPKPSKILEYCAIFVKPDSK